MDTITTFRIRESAQMLIGGSSLRPVEPATAQPTTARILLVGPDEAYWRQFHDALRYAGAELRCVDSGHQAIECLRGSAFDLLVLDDRLTDIPGMAVLVEARRLGGIPVLMITAGGPAAQTRAIDLGADDVVAAGLDPLGLARRAEALLHRDRPDEAAYEFGEPHGLTVSRATRQASVRGEPLRLTGTEFAILALLVEHRGVVMDADTVSRAVWHHETYGSPNFVQAQLSRLRAKLKQAGVHDLIDTIRGAGYVIR